MDTLQMYFSRIDAIENNCFNILAKLVCEVYRLGIFQNAEIIPIGYEDFNAIISTSTGKYLVKVFNNKRTDDNAYQCIERTKQASENGLPVPRVFPNAQGDFLSYMYIGTSRFRLAVIEYVDGVNFHQLGIKPTSDELISLVEMAYSLSKIKYVPPFIDDEWSIKNFLREFQLKRPRLTKRQISLIDPIYDSFAKFKFDALPKAFVHGDITSTNILRDKMGKLWLIDFSVSNYMARIIEVLIICDDLALVVGEREKSKERVSLCFDLWCRKVGATTFEREAFPLLFAVANAINVMNTEIERQEGMDSEENMMNMRQGLWGLSLISSDNLHLL